MTNEEIERNIHFIIEHQAHFAANVQFLTEQRLNAFIGVLDRRFSDDGRMRGKRKKRLG